MDIYLIRHGESYNSTIEYYDDDIKTMNPPLTERGIKQAANLAVRCKSIEFDLIISSDLSRAVQTAKQILSVVPCEFFNKSSFSGN